MADVSMRQMLEAGLITVSEPQNFMRKNNEPAIYRKRHFFI